MKKSYLTFAITVTCLLGMGISAHAQDARGVSVTVPFAFVVDGSKTMPAGTYKIGRVFPQAGPGLIIYAHGSSALLLPVAVDEASEGQEKLSFERVGDQYFLTKVGTPAGVYTIETARAITKLAELKDHSTFVSSGN